MFYSKVFRNKGTKICFQDLVALMFKRAQTEIVYVLSYTSSPECNQIHVDGSLRFFCKNLNSTKLSLGFNFK